MNRSLLASVVLGTLALAATVTGSHPAHALTTNDLSAKSTPDAKAALVLAELGKKNAGFGDLVSDVEMDLKDGARGEVKRHFQISILEKSAAADDGDRSLVSFDSPADVKGTALLSHSMANGDDEQWVYLPSSKRVKRIAVSNRGGAFMGSEFSYEDLTGADARRYNWTLMGTEACGASTCARLEAKPKDTSSIYSRREVVVELGEVRVQKVDFFDKSGAKMKTLTYGNYAPVGRYTRAMQWSMENAQTHRTTVLSFAGMRVGTGLSANDFSVAKLEQGH